MSYPNHRQRRSRAFRLELLESRELLTAVGLLAHRAVDVAPFAKVHHEIIKGSMSGQGFVSPTSSSTGTTSFSATGTLTTLGEASLAGSNSYSASRKHKIKYTNGAATIADSSGDRIIASFKGSGKEAGTGTFTFKVNGPVTGGTGTLAGATGTFSASGSLNTLTHAYTVSLTVKLKLA